MKYPRKSPHLIYKRTRHNDYKITDFYTGETVLLTSRETTFLKALDGKHNPYKLLPEYSKSDVKQLLREFKENDLLEPKKTLMTFGIGNCLYPLIHCYPEQWHRIAAGIINLAVMLLCIPVCALGLYLGADRLGYFYAESYGEFFGALLISLIVSVGMHELSHTCAGLAYGARVFEIGVGTKLFLPIGYVLMDDSNVRHRLRKIQIDAAGIEMNLFLAGLLLLLPIPHFISLFTVNYVIVLNLIMAGLNALPLSGLDGMHIMSNVFGKKDLLRYAWRLIRNSITGKGNVPKGIGGAAAVAASFCLVGFQIVLPLVMIQEVYSLVILIRILLERFF